MATSFSEFDSTPATIVADVKAKLITSTDWTNITANIVKATSDNGCELVVDLQKAAAGNTQMNMSVWRSHNGTTGTDEKLCYLTWKRSTAATAASTDPVHVKVSAGKNHLYIQMEGGRGGETNAESATLGSARHSFYLGEITPYFDAGLDPVDSCLLVANTLATGTSDQRNAYVNRNAANNASWVPAYLHSLSSYPVGVTAHQAGNFVGLDGKTYLLPWMVWEIAGGIRGRLTDTWSGGPTTDLIATAVTSDPVLREGQRYTYGGKTFQLFAPMRGAGTGAQASGLPWSPSAAASLGVSPTALIAVPVV